MKCLLSSPFITFMVILAMVNYQNLMYVRGSTIQENSSMMKDLLSIKSIVNNGSQLYELEPDLELGRLSFYPLMTFSCSGRINVVTFVGKQTEPPIGAPTTETDVPQFSVWSPESGEQQSSYLYNIRDLLRATSCQNEQTGVYCVNTTSSGMTFNEGDIFGIDQPGSRSDNRLNVYHQSGGGLNLFYTQFWWRTVAVVHDNLPLVGLITTHPECVHGFLNGNTLIQVSKILQRVNTSDSTVSPNLIPLSTGDHKLLFPGVVFNTAGYITRWVFAAKFDHNSEEAWPEFQVWRRTNTNIYIEVGSSSTKPEPTGNLNIYQARVPSSDPIAVCPGDILGLKQPIGQFSVAAYKLNETNSDGYLIFDPSMPRNGFRECRDTFTDSNCNLLPLVSAEIEPSASTVTSHDTCMPPTTSTDDTVSDTLSTTDATTSESAIQPSTKSITYTQETQPLTTEATPTSEPDDSTSEPESDDSMLTTVTPTSEQDDSMLTTVTPTSEQDDSMLTTVTPTSEQDDSMLTTLTPTSERDDSMLTTVTPTSERDDSMLTTVTPTSEQDESTTSTPLQTDDTPTLEAVITRVSSPKDNTSPASTIPSSTDISSQTSMTSETAKPTLFSTTSKNKVDTPTTYIEPGTKGSSDYTIKEGATQMISKPTTQTMPTTKKKDDNLYTKPWPSTKSPPVSEMTTNDKMGSVNQARDGSSTVAGVSVGVILLMMLLVLSAIVIVVIVYLMKRRKNKKMRSKKASTVTDEVLLSNPIYSNSNGRSNRRGSCQVGLTSFSSAPMSPQLYDDPQDILTNPDVAPTPVKPLYHILECNDTTDVGHKVQRSMETGFIEKEYEDNHSHQGVYVPTMQERKMLGKLSENVYQTLEENQQSMLEASPSQPVSQTFFEESDTYWKPASDQKELYGQLASKKYREILRNQIQITEHLGSGQFGTVSKGVWQLPGGQSKDVAVKTLREGATEVDKVKFLQEAAINGQFWHPNVVKLMGVVTVGEPVMIVLEYISNGNLKDFLVKLRPIPGQLVESNTPHVLHRFCKEIALGMKYLSGKHFVHRDLAARNILVSAEKHCKISDFGMSRDVEDETYYVAHGGKIPIKWTAPEAIHYKKYSTASDVWSFGAVMYEIWSLGHKPFETDTNRQVLRKVDRGIRLPPPPGCPKEMYRLMIQCWNPDKSLRPTFSRLHHELSKNPYSYNLFDMTDNSSSKLHPQSGVLGAPLEAGTNLYLGFQNAYVM